MKKSLGITILAAIMLLMASVSFSAEWVNGSGNKTADALISIQPGNLSGIIAVADGTNAITISIYDNTAASGVLVVPTIIVPATATYGYAVGFDPPVHFNNGLYVDITCAGTANYIIYTTR